MLSEKKVVRLAKKGAIIRQVAAVPFRLNGDGQIEVLLITSGTTRRFIVPKGWPMKGKSARSAAATEVREEAGVKGVTLKKPLGEYSYWKRLSRQFVQVKVKVFLLEVSHESPDWKESAKRSRAWLAPADAARLIDETQLSALIATLPEVLAARDGPAGEDNT